MKPDKERWSLAWITPNTAIRISLGEIRSGDKAAFVALVRRYDRPLRALVRDRLGSGDAVEDVLQETLMRAWSGLRVQEPEERARMALPGGAKPLQRLPAFGAPAGADCRGREELTRTVNRMGSG